MRPRERGGKEAHHAHREHYGDFVDLDAGMDSVDSVERMSAGDVKQKNTLQFRFRIGRLAWVIKSGQVTV